MPKEKLYSVSLSIMRKKKSNDKSSPIAFDQISVHYTVIDPNSRAAKLTGDTRFLLPIKIGSGSALFSAVIERRLRKQVKRYACVKTCLQLLESKSVAFYVGALDAGNRTATHILQVVWRCTECLCVCARALCVYESIAV